MKKTEYLKTDVFKNERKTHDKNQSNYDSKWEKFSRSYRRNHPWCVECRKKGIWNDDKIHTDHIVPLEIAPDRKYDLTNLQSLCSSCHSVKTHDEKLSEQAKANEITEIKRKLAIRYKNPMTDEQ